MKYYGAIEAGGTKFVCSIASDPDHYAEEVRFPTTTPEETIGRTIDFFKQKTGAEAPVFAVLRILSKKTMEWANGNQVSLKSSGL